VQRHGQGVQVGTLVTGRADRSGKAATGEEVTGWATDRVERMLVCQQANVRRIQDVTASDDAAWDTTEVRMALAADAPAHRKRAASCSFDGLVPGGLRAP
jgi:adenosyl cobinamide kinase/adenosyl cobinamide phosphate guanylyltransferase